ncbi:cytochrome P450 [Aspergillus brunneoviolaceus CBS 621.78]|uniref:Cytochrome P450 n=1 Tax=Aspergillus brunneoviolaceus CBS 621.78 TaxID=1450534 RepID=A0ACD1FS08_9EURO|nr:cytochrome P450 [Aspergillus brunneoviolaceus CBS 621.78]RAH39749.1 cytochrome P450 [Aspergillus brunneoviolaceus CBS 621.78]
MFAYLEGFETSLARTVILLAIIVSAVYNLFFHPLRAYPGPLLWRMTSLPWCYHQMKGDRTHLQAQMHWRYGDVVRIRPNELSYTSYQAWDDIFVHHPNRPEFPKDPRRQRRNPNKLEHILSAPKADHSRYRRLLAGAFSERGLRAQEPLINQHLDLLLQRLTALATAGESVNFTEWYNMMVFDVIGDLAWGESFHSLREGKLHEWIPEIALTVKFAMQSSPLLEYGLGWLIPLFVSRTVREQRAANYRFSEAKVAQRLRVKGARGDFWDRVVIKSADDNRTGEGMTRGEMLNNASILVLAGSETSATTLCGMTYFLLRNPAAYRRLVAEIRGAFSARADITMVSLGHLPYLNAVFQETLRLYPPVPTHSQRVPPKGGALVCGQWIPENTSVGISMMGACLDPENFHRAREFCPERWPEDAPVEFRQDNKAVYQPWSMGTRNCLGRNLALAEIRLIMANLLWTFDLEIDQDRMGRRAGEWIDQKIWGVWFKKPLWVSLRLARDQVSS